MVSQHKSSQGEEGENLLKFLMDVFDFLISDLAFVSLFLIT